MLERFLENPSAPNLLLLLAFLVLGSVFYTFMFEGRAGVVAELGLVWVAWPICIGAGVALAMCLRGEWASGFATLSVGVVMTALLFRRSRRAS